VNRIYYSKINDPEEWTTAKSYWFPFAEKLMAYQFGRLILKAYLWIREGEGK
jgi:hypothetical protein